MVRGREYMLRKIRYVLHKRMSQGFLGSCRRKRLRKKLQNPNISILSQNCVGGIIYHDLGLQFRSPTINLYMSAADFVAFLENLPLYLQTPLAFVESDRPYPVGKLADLTLYFVHYKSEADALEKWELRKRRIDMSNLYIIMTDRDGCDESVVRRFEALPYEHKVMFTAKKYDNAPHCVQLKRERRKLQVGDVNEFVNCFGKRLFEEGINHIQWFNSEK